MAKILVMAKDHGSIRKGTIINRMPDNHEYGQAEGPPLFVVIEIPGVSVNDLDPSLLEYNDSDGRSKYKFNDELIDNALLLPKGRTSVLASDIPKKVRVR